MFVKAKILVSCVGVWDGSTFSYAEGETVSMPEDLYDDLRSGILVEKVEEEKPKTSTKKKTTTKKVKE